MPHPVGGAMGVALCTREKGHTRFDIISLNIHKNFALAFAWLLYFDLDC